MSGILKNVFGGAESSGAVKPDDGKLSVRSSTPTLFAMAAITGLV